MFYLVGYLEAKDQITLALDFTIQTATLVTHIVQLAVQITKFTISITRRLYVVPSPYNARVIPVFALHVQPTIL